MVLSVLFASTVFVANAQFDDLAGLFGNETVTADPSFVLGFVGSVVGDSSPIEFTCEADDDCSGLGSGFACNMDAGLCIFKCDDDADCAELGTGTGLGSCVDGACAVSDSCSTDDDCASILGFTCGDDNTCKDPATCSDDADCTRDGLSCNDLGVCEPTSCSESSDCSTGYTCVAETGYCIESCVTEDYCQGPLFCDEDTGLCAIECTSDDQCTGFTNTCADGTCILTCTTTADCDEVGIPNSECITLDGTGSCLPAQNIIVGGDTCATDADCDGGAVCNTDVGVCYSDCETSDDCEGTQQCVEASTLPMLGEMLPDGTKTCADPSSSECSSDSDCADGYKCNSLLGSTCYPSCDSDADCVSLGFPEGTPCATNSFNVVLTTIEIKFCDPASTPSPTMADKSETGSYKVMLGLMSVLAVAALM